MTLTPQHRLIMASAGSGKTYQLVHRYIALLAEGAEPGRILAATFARKAAAEIFDKIMVRLCEAAADPARAAETAAEIRRPDLGPGDFAAMLAAMIRAMPRLKIATLDSFIIGIVRSFPMELGIEPELSLMNGDGREARAVRASVFRWIFASPDLADRDRQAFMEAFKLATFGEEGVACEETLDRFVLAYARLYQVMDHARQWGAADEVGADPALWYRSGDDPGIAEALEALRAWVDAAPLNKSNRAWWRKLLEAAESTLSEGNGGRLVKSDLFERVLTALIERAPDGGADLTMNREDIAIDPAPARAWRLVLARLFRDELEVCRTRAFGLYALLAQYDLVYQNRAIARGLLSFEDAARLLARRRPATGGESGSDPDRLWLDYRMDGRIDHWLLDEFQDTSTLQWSILEPMADEVLQGAGDDRSFFCVGDVKQSIYRWRSGNPRLMTSLRDRYRKVFGEGGVLSTSYRSAPAVIDFVNAVFGSLDRVGWDPPGQDAATRWKDLWEAHQVAERNRDLTGYAAVIEPETRREDGKPDGEDVARLVIDLLGTIQPLRRGFSVGILVSRNAVANDLAQKVRAAFPDWPVSQPGGTGHLDNIATPVLLSLVQAVLHPADSLALRHLQMSPLEAEVPPPGDSGAGWRAQQREQLGREGLTAWLTGWAVRLLAAIPTSLFLAHRIGRLLDVARRFEEAGEDLDEFAEAVADDAVSEEGAEHSIRIMTVHKAKGLEFDLVILPELNRRGAGAGSMLVREDETTGRPEWILKKPATGWEGADPAIAEALHANDRDDQFDDLCTLYVAVTRARRALYAITTWPGKSSQSLTDAAILKEALGWPRTQLADREIPLSGKAKARLVHETSAENRAWYEDRPFRKKDRTRASLAARKAVRRPAGAVRRTPSAEAEAPREATLLFEPAVTDSLAIGHGVHALLEKVTWRGEVDPESLFAAWVREASPDDRVRDAVRKHWETALASPALAAPGRPGHAAAEVWNEYTFDCLVDGQWVTGAFDRIVVYRDAAGAVTAADILDYKTNQLDGPEAAAGLADKYRPQLALYRTVLAKILGIGEDAVSAALVLTRNGEVVSIAGAPKGTSPYGEASPRA